MFSTTQLHALAAVLRTGSFEGAAHDLGLTQSAISQRIRALEDRAGAVLIVRETPCRATETGQRLCRHYEEIALLDRQLARDLGDRHGPRTALRIAVNADSLATWILPALVATDDFLFEVEIVDQDHSANLLREGKVIAAITGHPGPVQGCDTLPLGKLRYLAVATPEFAARWFPDGLTPAALSEAPALVFSEKDRLQTDWAAELTGRRVRLPAHLLPSSTAFVEAALLGLGWGMNPEALVADHVAAGRLVTLAPKAPLDTALYWISARVGRGALADLNRAIREAARAALRPA
ncbi:MAG: LysR family transcriptional regulator ArgP [Pseudomonadota bacterium]